MFGYLIPGATFFLAIYFFEFWTNQVLAGKESKLNLFVYTVINVGWKNVSGDSWPLHAIFFLIIVLVSYIAGHVISSISSFVIDRVLIHKGYKYPYQILLKINNNNSDYSRGFYKGLIFWCNLLLLLLYLDISPYLALANSPCISSIINKLIALILMYITLAIVIKLLISKSKKIKSEPIKKFMNSFLRYFALCYDVITKMLAGFHKSREPFDDHFIEKYKQSFLKNFKLSSEDAGTNNYWFSAFYIAQKSPTLSALLTKWREIYGFARNLSTAFFLAFLYCLVSLYYHQLIGVPVFPDNFSTFFLPLSYFFLSLIMLSRYYYLYFCYYSKSVFRIFYFLDVDSSRLLDTK